MFLFISPQVRKNKCLLCSKPIPEWDLHEHCYACRECCKAARCPTCRTWKKEWALLEKWKKRGESSSGPTESVQEAPKNTASIVPSGPANPDHGATIEQAPAALRPANPGQSQEASISGFTAESLPSTPIHQQTMDLSSCSQANPLSSPLPILHSSLGGQVSSLRGNPPFQHYNPQGNAPFHQGFIPNYQGGGLFVPMSGESSRSGGQGVWLPSRQAFVDQSGLNQQFSSSLCTPAASSNDPAIHRAPVQASGQTSSTAEVVLVEGSESHSETEHRRSRSRKRKKAHSRRRSSSSSSSSDRDRRSRRRRSSPDSRGLSQIVSLLTQVVQGAALPSSSGISQAADAPGPSRRFSERDPGLSRKFSERDPDLSRRFSKGDSDLSRRFQEGDSGLSRNFSDGDPEQEQELESTGDSSLFHSPSSSVGVPPVSAEENSDSDEEPLYGTDLTKEAFDKAVEVLRRQLGFDSESVPQPSQSSSRKSKLSLNRPVAAPRVSMPVDVECSDRLKATATSRKWTPFPRRQVSAFRVDEKDWKDLFCSPSLPDDALDFLREAGATDHQGKYKAQATRKFESSLAQSDAAARVGLKYSSSLLLVAEVLSKASRSEEVPKKDWSALVNILGPLSRRIFDQFSRVVVRSLLDRRDLVLDSLDWIPKEAKRRFQKLPLLGPDIFGGEFGSQVQSEVKRRKDLKDADIRPSRLTSQGSSVRSSLKRTQSKPQSFRRPAPPGRREPPRSGRSSFPPLRSRPSTSRGSRRGRSSSRP